MIGDMTDPTNYDRVWSHRILLLGSVKGSGNFINCRVLQFNGPHEIKPNFKF